MKKSNSDKVTLYTDGSSIGNPGPGGFATILTYKEKEKIVGKGYRMTTNNRMELKAVIEGLKLLKKKNISVELVSDSKYVLESILKGWVFQWKKKGFKNKKNVDLWEEYLSIEKDYHISCKWIKGHSGHIYNERCDQIAKNCALQNPQDIDEGYENIKQKPVFIK